MRVIMWFFIGIAFGLGLMGFWFMFKYKITFNKEENNNGTKH